MTDSEKFEIVKILEREGLNAEQILNLLCMIAIHVEANKSGPIYVIDEPDESFHEVFKLEDEFKIDAETKPAPRSVEFKKEIL